MMHVLLSLLDASHASYRVLEHAPEGRSAAVSALRKDQLEQGAKSMVVRVQKQKGRRYVLAVVPAHARVNLRAIGILCAADKVAFATVAEAQRVTGCIMGAIPPFSLLGTVEIIVDPLLLTHPEISFNAARLDCSVFLKTTDYLRIVQPRVARIIEEITSSTSSRIPSEVCPSFQ